VTPGVTILDCSPASVRDEDCITLDAAIATYKAPAEAALGVHCTQNIGPAGVGCRSSMEGSERWACLIHSKEWTCGDPMVWTGMIPLCEESANIDIELGPPLVLRKQ